MTNEILQIRNKIKQLEAEIAEREREIEKLLSPEKQVILPHDFSLNDEIFSIIEQVQSESGITIRELLGELLKKFPNYAINRQKVASSLAYLKNYHKKIEIAGRGAYRIKSHEIVHTNTAVNPEINVENIPF